MVKVKVIDAAGGKEHEFEVKKSDLIKELRDRILEEAKKVPGRDYVEARHLRLVHMGTEMEDGPDEPGKQHQVFQYRVCDGSQVLLFLRPKEVDEPVDKEDSQREAAADASSSSSSSSSGSSAPAPFVVPPIEQEHLDNALSVSLVTERTKVKLICTPETGDDLLPHEEGIPLGVISRARRVFHLDADTVAKFQDSKGKFAYICFDLNGADLPNPEGVDTHCIMRRRKELPKTGNNLALWLIYQNVELDKKTSAGLPARPAAAARGRKPAAAAATTAAAATKENESGTVEKGNTVLAFRLKRPEDLEEGYYTLGVTDPTAPDEPCEVCRSHDDPEKTLVCDQCGEGYHIYCLNPPLPQVPADDVDWYCPNCFNDPEAVKATMSETKRGQALGAKKRGWGGGMANAGIKVKCTIVDNEFSGPIPGTWVGQTWPFRVDCSGAGVHREMIAGIAGSVKMGKAVSIVVAGGYEDDDDMGDTFKYSGSGGRNLKDGNKRTADQSSDQMWTKRNLALAMSCVGFKHKCNKDYKGHVCEECQERWREGKPIRVVRSNTAKEYGPRTSGKKLYRYDGIYKVVDFWHEAGKSGFKVCRYLLRRDDPTPAPWTAAGKAYIKKMLSGSNKAKEEKQKMRKLRVLIERDALNKRTWDNLVPQIETATLGQFLDEVNREFACMICQTLVDIPYTFPCGHNICQDCFKHFKTKATKMECAMCRAEVAADFIKSAKYNEFLVDILATLLPNHQLPPGHQVHEVHIEPCAEDDEQETVEVEAEEEEEEVVEAKAPAKKRKAASPKKRAPAKKPAAKRATSKKGKEKLVEDEDEIDVDGDVDDEEEEEEQKPVKRVRRAAGEAAKSARGKPVAVAPKRKRGDAVIVIDDDDDAFQMPAKKKRTSLDSKPQSAAAASKMDTDEDDDPLLSTRSAKKKKPEAAREPEVDDEEDEADDAADDHDDLDYTVSSEVEIGTNGDDIIDERDIGKSWDLWIEDGAPCRELTNFALLWKTRSFIDMERIGEGLSIRATGTLVAPPDSANLGEIKVLLPSITEWTLDYTNACLWLRTPLAWYKLGKPLPEYEPHFKEVNVKFEICNYLTSILEDEDNADIDFDRTISEMKEASKGKYDEQHLLKRVEFIEEKLLQFPEAEATKKRFVRQMKSKLGHVATPARASAPTRKKKKASTTASSKSTAKATKVASTAKPAATAATPATAKANQKPEATQPSGGKSTLDHFWKRD